MSTSLIRLPAVIARTGLARSTIYLRMKEGTFPLAIGLGGTRAIGWVESDIDRWVDERIKHARWAVSMTGTAMTGTRGSRWKPGCVSWRA